MPPLHTEITRIASPLRACPSGPRPLVAGGQRVLARVGQAEAEGRLHQPALLEIQHPLKQAAAVDLAPCQLVAELVLGDV